MNAVVNYVLMLNYKKYEIFMEKLSVENFSVIKKAELEVGMINVIIGAQANGKSLLAKLLYFFREFLSVTYLESIKDSLCKSDLQKQAVTKFGDYFPKYTWENQNFTIKYSIEETEVEIIKIKSKVTFNYSKNLSTLHTKLKSEYKRKIDVHSLDEDDFFEPRDAVCYEETIKKLVYSQPEKRYFYRSLFIPAGRSFFAILQKNVFSFLARSIDLDPFVIQFGSRYENAKWMYSRFIRDKTNIHGNQILLEQAREIIRDILSGTYHFEDDQDWIVNEKSKIKLLNASSGQQEALPMLLVMVMTAIFSGEMKLSLFIEEPEAHLFPVSQKHIISLAALIHNLAKREFIITTHSPYVLTAINNFILANDTAEKYGEDVVKPIVNPDLFIKYENVRAYTMKDGFLESIMDDENRLIGASIIDSVSNEFSDVFDKLLEINYWNQSNDTIE